MKQTTLRTTLDVKHTPNISFPIGTVVAVTQYYQKLGFDSIFRKHKKKGRDINSLIHALVSYRLTENQSISRASEWINRKEVLNIFRLDDFEERTLFRVLEIVGSNKEEILSEIQDKIFATYSFEHTDINLDWTSLVLYGEKCPIGKYGYSRDHRPDKKQITVGLAELASPINIPIGLTIKQGNTNDQAHFKDTFMQVSRRLKDGSLVVYDKGANSKDNNELVLANKMKYLTSKKLNLSDDKRIKAFDKRKAKLIDKETGLYGIKIEFPSRYDYFLFSEKLKQDQIESSIRRALRKFEDAKMLQDCLDKHKKLPAKFRIKNELVDITYSYQTKLKELGEKEALKYIKKHSITGREGFFCLTSSENLTLEEAVHTYRKKDSIEKMINSLKNEIDIKPLRVWSVNSIYGAVLIGFIAQLIMSLIKYEHKELKNTSVKFIKISLMNLTVTVEFLPKMAKRYIYSNFDPINELILATKLAET
jgi:transposase